MQSKSLVSLLLVGMYYTGKTHYGSQLGVRLHRGHCRLKINGEVINREPFAQAGELIAQGKSAPHTPPGVDRESLWPVMTDNGKEAEIIWPDYSGETVRQIVRERKVDTRWEQRIKTSHAWILFVRPRLILNSRDVWERPDHVAKAKRARDTGDAIEGQWHEQAELIELLQILLFVKRISLERPISSLPLVIGLTCWDELSQSIKRRKPLNALRTVAPLFASFVESNWQSNALIVYGISATGKELSERMPDDDYQNHGAHTQGWIIQPSGEKSEDLTIPIANLIESIEAK